VHEHAPGVQVDAAVESVGVLVKSRGPGLLGDGPVCRSRLVVGSAPRTPARAWLYQRLSEE
jgi:hypothetical protein